MTRFRTARRAEDVVVLEGFHALKHAVRFGADVIEAVTADPTQLRELCDALAPDLRAPIEGMCEQISPAEFSDLTEHPPRTGVIAIARRPAVDVAAVVADIRDRPVVVLEDPRNLGNLGACVRVAAAADAAGVLVTGTSDPWHPDAVRGAAGLQFALPVARVGEIPRDDRPVVAIDPAGTALGECRLDPRSVLTFGTERHGLDPSIRATADLCVAIPMRPGVSSLNLATSVAAVLFGASFGRSA